jgi:hypothetical protein
MKKKRQRLIGAVLAALVVICAIAFSNNSAQEKIPAQNLTTNWVGFLVVGQVELADPIAGRGPFPKGDKSIQVGLRSDGVVVWRKAAGN